ncbi:hypothetical protein [Streptomyces albireticuli]|uniref:hypothetical protein n=1 Tax=Streptomyces albireticuli TaxID=1940 RepID=UPI00117CE7C9|nr:hypothetical protein [Streptomyces albireticuli]MCD9141443.1 hypothetical protein [Streptomyces albireticuli]MCD9160596.1 hypothetical protein [Streptomyces albireticuli]MCD9195848.1 hypothetical protein [Streptomyces albireticuli]
MRAARNGAPRRARAGAVAAALAATAALSVTPAPAASATGDTARPASAAPSSGAARTCYIRERSPHADTLGNFFTKDLYCENAAGQLYGRAAFLAPVTGLLKTTTSWFVCWTLGDPHQGGNSVWYYTQGQETVQIPSVLGWGSIPANYLWTDQDPYPGLPRCPWR